MKKTDNQSIDITLKSISSLLEKTGYTDDPRLLPRLKNISFYHKARRRMFSGGLPPTMSGIEEKFQFIEKNYDLLKIGFWSVFPIFFAAVSSKKLDDLGFPNLVKKYNRDLSLFFQYCTKCTFRITIWPKVQVHSYPKGYLAIVDDKGDIQNDSIEILKNEWSKLPDFEKFYVLPPIIIDPKKKDIILPFTRSKLSKYPPSFKELKKIL